MFGSWWHTFAGNVLGEPGRMDGWIYEDPGDGTYGHATSRLGEAVRHLETRLRPGVWDQAPDPTVRSTVVREGNFDYVTNSVRWDHEPRDLPNSLYLTEKPAFFGDLPWPWVDPTGTTKVGRSRRASASTAGCPSPSGCPRPQRMSAHRGRPTARRGTTNAAPI